MPVTAFQIATFVVATVGLVIAAMSLGWNVAQFLLTGGRAKVELVRGALTPTGVLTVPPGPGMTRQLARLAGEYGFTDEVIGVVVTNPGRSPIRVQRWGVTCPGTAEFWVLGDSIGPDLPAVIDGGAQQTWVMPVKAASALAYASAGITSGNPPVHGTVELGTGKHLTTKNSTTFESGNR